VKFPSKYKKPVDLTLTSKDLNRNKSSKASKRLGMKNLVDETFEKLSFLGRVTRQKSNKGYLFRIFQLQ
jgi:hypothetical protein